MSRYQLIIFDWDGTLMDSLARICHCMQAAAKQLGVAPASEAAIRQIVGLALGQAIERLHPELQKQDVLLMRQYYSDHYVQAETHPNSFFPGIPQMLHNLKQRGLLLSVATGKSRKGLSRVMQAHAVEALFDSSRCADETRSKPEPDMLQEILALHRLDSSQALMVGDTEYDLEMAYRIGMDALGVTWGAHSRQQLQRHSPVSCMDTVGDLSTWLNLI